MASWIDDVIGGENAKAEGTLQDQNVLIELHEAMVNSLLYIYRQETQQLGTNHILDLHGAMLLFVMLKHIRSLYQRHLLFVK